MIVRPIVKGGANILFHLFYKMEVDGIENIPKEGAALICLNHIHALDPVFAVIHVKRMVYAMAKEELFQGKVKNWFFRKLGVFPVKRGKTDIEAVRVAEEHLKKGDLLAIYPEGTRNGMKKGLKPKRGAAMLAINTKVPVVPVGMTGSFKPFTKLTIKFGKPIRLEEFYGCEINRANIDAATNKIMDGIKALLPESEYLPVKEEKTIE